MRVDLFTKETYLKLLKQHMKPKLFVFLFGCFFFRNSEIF